MLSLKHFSKLVVLFCTAPFITAPSASAAGISASAFYSATADVNTAGLYDYTLTLNNTGATTIGTFWFAWIPGGDFLNPVPSSITQPSGWANRPITTLQGTSIQWTTSSALLQPGQALSGFGFTSTETPAQLLGSVPSGTGAGDAITTSFVYIAAPFKDPGQQFAATAITPEPSSLLLLATGLLGPAGTLYRRTRSTL